MRKNKLYFLWLVLISFPLLAQEYTETVAPPEPVEVYDEEYNPVNPTPSKEEIGEVLYEKRNLDPDFKNKYTDKKFDYDRVVKQKEFKPPSPPLFSLPTGLFQFLMYAALAIIILLVIYFIIKNAGGFSFGREKKKINFSSSAEQALEDTDHIENNDFQKLIQKAKSENDFRRAIRYYHLWVLQSLADKKLIRWNRDKTDYDYFKELGQNAIKEDFSHGIYVYDYIWYGNFQINPKEFDIAESIFQRTLEKLR